MKEISIIPVFLIISIAAYAAETFTNISNICGRSKTYEECVECCDNSSQLQFNRIVDIHCVKNPDADMEVAGASNAFFVSAGWFDVKTKDAICGKSIHFKQDNSSIDDCMLACKGKK